MAVADVAVWLRDLHYTAAGGRSMRKVGRVIDRAGLEIRYTLFGYRGFESLTFRHNRKKSIREVLFFYLYITEKSLLV